MANLDDYVRIALYEKFPANVSFSQEYREQETIESYFASQFLETLKNFGIAGSIDERYFARLLFNELDSVGLVDHLPDPLAGTFYWCDLKKARQYMVDVLNSSEIYARKQKLSGDRLFEIVFAKIDELDPTTKLGQDELKSLSPLDQNKWKSELSESERAEFRGYLPEIRKEIEASDLSQEQRSDALAALDAVDTLSDAPHPMWEVIATILSSPVLMNITALVTLAVAVLTI